VSGTRHKQSGARVLRYSTLALVITVAALAHPQSAGRANAAPASARKQFIGAWHLLWMESPGPDGKVIRTTDVKGMLIYTRDGHMSVQLMYPPSQSALSNDYVRSGYEASFGRYEVNEKAQTVTHHVEGSITPALVGKNLARVYHFSNARLIVHSTRPDEHWSVAWEHDGAETPAGLLQPVHAQSHF
jgi:hypothetical protein